MKRIILLVVAVMFVGTAAYAQVSKTAGTLPGGKKLNAIIERAQGKVESLQKADEAKANWGGFSITDANGKKKNFELIAKSRLYSVNVSPINLSDLKKGDQIVVLYVVTLKGINEVITVTQIK